MPVGCFFDTNVLISSVAGAIRAASACRDSAPCPRRRALDTHNTALKIAQDYSFHIYDALVIASALQANCDTPYTEDLQDDQLIGQRLTVRNPFPIQHRQKSN